MTVNEPIFDGATKQAHDADDETTTDRNMKKGDETAHHPTPLVSASTTASTTAASQETLSGNEGEGLSSSPAGMDDNGANTHTHQQAEAKCNTHDDNDKGEKHSANADACADAGADVSEGAAAAHTARVEKLRAELGAKKGWDRPDLGADQFGYYMHEKQRKLREQFAAEGHHHHNKTQPNRQSQQQSQGKQNGGLFEGVTVWVDGRTSPSRLEIRRLVMQGGGLFETYFTSRVTHVVADCLAAATKKRWLACGKTGGTGTSTSASRGGGGSSVTKFVTGRWIKRCVENGARVPERDFITPGMVDKSQKSVAAMFSARGGGSRAGGSGTAFASMMKPSSAIQKKKQPAAQTKK